MIKFILLGILLVFTVHQAFAENVTMTTDSSEFYFLVGENVAVETTINSSFQIHLLEILNTLTGDSHYCTTTRDSQQNNQNDPSQSSSCVFEFFSQSSTILWKLVVL